MSEVYPQAPQANNYLAFRRCSSLLATRPVVYISAESSIPGLANMLVIEVKIGGVVLAGQDIKVKVLSVDGRRVRLGFDAPIEIPIRREIVARHASLTATKRRKT